MNLILLKPTDFISDNIAKLSDFRFEHIKSVLKLSNGDLLNAGLINGKMGSGKICEICESSVILETTLTQNPPNPNPSILFCALPRPKVFRRVLSNAVCFGVKQIHFFHSFKVEKSYWQSPFLSDGSINEIVENGLSQAVDTIVPQIYFHKQFKIFVEDEFVKTSKKHKCFVFHPCENQAAISKETCGIIIGPEGGFTDYEIGKFVENNAEITSLGKRILRVEQAVCAVLSRF